MILLWAKASLPHQNREYQTEFKASGSLQKPWANMGFFPLLAGFYGSIFINAFFRAVGVTLAV